MKGSCKTLEKNNNEAWKKGRQISLRDCHFIGVTLREMDSCSRKNLFLTLRELCFFFSSGSFQRGWRRGVRMGVGEVWSTLS